MAKPRDKVYSATRRLDLVQFMRASDRVAMAMFYTMIDEQMAEVQAKMTREGAAPNKAAPPDLIITFTAKGGKHHVDKDSQGDGAAT